ncbi:MAG: DUF1565 domain-containing protein [Oscillatoria sp. SIO1A7]|nr:DUF1565 domain-containing protein [Oscillatoria sp. SIO1A7]
MKLKFTCLSLVTALALSSATILLILESGLRVRAQEVQPEFPAAQGEAIARRIIYVNPTSGTDDPSAGDRTAPLRTITYALQQVQGESKTTIQLAVGEYGEQETFPLQLKPNVVLRGNPVLAGEGIIINGGGRHGSPTMARQNSTIVVAENSEILGITITNPNTRGTGVWIEDVTAKIHKNIFTDNNREGIFVAGSASGLIENNNFFENQGNGLSVNGEATVEIRNNVFENTGYGLAIGGTSAPKVIANKIENNRAGLVITDEAVPILEENKITNNDQYGILIGDECQPVLNNNIFEGNEPEDIIRL